MLPCFFARTLIGSRAPREYWWRVGITDRDDGEYKASSYIDFVSEEGVVPLVIAFLFVQRFFVDGISNGSIIG